MSAIARISLRTLILPVLTIVAFAAFVLSTVLPAAYAQAPLPPRPPAPFSPVLPPASHTFPPHVAVTWRTIDATVQGPVATVHFTQELRNNGSQSAEGVVVFPLPRDASVSDFQMTVDGATLEGQLLGKDAARSIYEEIVRRQRDPALLEYLGRGLFQTSVFPIPPHAARQVALTYTQVLAPENGLYRFNVPLTTRAAGAAGAPAPQSAAPLTITVRFTDQPGLRTLYSPSYPIQVERQGVDGALVRYTSQQEAPQGDFDLFFGVDDQAVGLNLLTYQPAGEDGYFVLLAAPALDASPTEIVDRDVIVVLDVSGSMQGEKLAQAQAAARFVVDHLNPNDRFNVIAFSTGIQRWQKDLQPVNGDTLKAAHTWIDRLQSTGSTDFNRALLEALAQLKPDAAAADRPGYILFLTDGQPTIGESNPARIVDNAKNNAPAARSVRLFTFGVGYDVNTDLLSEVSQTLGGRDQYVTPGERVDEAISAFYSQMQAPVLAGVNLEFRGPVTVDDLYPSPLPDLFAGQQLVLAGRYHGSGPVDVELSGQVNGAPRLYVYPKRTFTDDGGEAVIARLWATRKIGALLEGIRRSGASDEVIDAIVDLSLRYGIVTPYTSYLVQEQNFAGHAPAAMTEAAPADLAGTARSEVAAAAATMAAAAPSGAAAVDASKLRSELKSTETVAGTAGLRYAGGRTFRLDQVIVDAAGQRHELWVDTQYKPDMKLTTVPFASNAYFALLDKPDMAAYLAVAPEIIVVTGPGEAVKVTVKDN